MLHVTAAWCKRSVQTLHKTNAAHKCCLLALHPEMQSLGATGAGGAGGSRGEECQGLQQPRCTQQGCQAGRPGWLTPWKAQEKGVRSDAWTGARQDKAGGEFASRGFKSSCTPVAAGGVSPALTPTVLGLRTRTPAQGLHPNPAATKPRALAPCSVWHQAPQGAGGMLGHPGVPGRQAGVHQQWDARSSSVQGQAPEPIGKRSRGGGWHPPAGSSARSAVSPGQGQEEARLRHCRLPCQTSTPEEALSAANASQQPPQSLRAWQDALRLHLLQMDCIRGRTKHWRVFKEKLQSQPAREAAGPLWRHLTGDSAGSGLGTKTHQAAGCCPLALPSWPQLYCPMVEAGQEPFNGCWPEDSSSIFTKKCPAAKSGFSPAANEKLRLGLWFSPAPRFLGKLVRARIWSKC